MLHLLDDALESFLRSTVPLESREVDVAFDPPDREWGSSLNRPTVNVFLWNILRNGERTSAGTRPQVVDGNVVYAAPPVPMEFRYLVTAWSAQHDDEKQLLGAVLQAINAATTIPRVHLAPELDEIPTPELALAATGAEHQSDLWSALDGQLKPGLQVVVRCYLPGPEPQAAGGPVEQIGFKLSDPSSSGRSAGRRRVAGKIDDPAAVGAVVRAPGAATMVDGVGRFVVRAQAGDEVVIETDPPVTVVVPEDGGISLP